MTTFFKFIFCLILSLVQIQAECNQNKIFQALNECHNQRLILSNASETISNNNYTQLCNSFFNYMKCIEPRILECKGTALLGFNIIKKTYTKKPYYCSLSNQAELMSSIIFDKKDHLQTGFTSFQTSPSSCLPNSTPVFQSNCKFLLSLCLAMVQTIQIYFI